MLPSFQKEQSKFEACFVDAFTLPQLFLVEQSFYNPSLDKVWRQGLCGLCDKYMYNRLVYIHIVWKCKVKYVQEVYISVRSVQMFV